MSRADVIPSASEGSCRGSYGHKRCWRRLAPRRSSDAHDPALRAGAPDFLRFCLDPDLTTEATLQPIRRYGFDAAILFSDIFVPPYALGHGVRFEAGEGPVVDRVTGIAQVEALDLGRARDAWAPVMETVRRLRATLPAIAENASRSERVAMEAEREIVALKKVQFMADKIGRTFGGFVSDVARFGFFVELDDYFVEGLVHVGTLTDDAYEHVERAHLLRGRRRRRTFRIGDRVRVRVAGVSIERRQIDLVLDS